MADCLKCKWFTGLTLQDECGTYYGICKALEDELMMNEDEASEDLPCDLYVEHDLHNNSTERA